MKALLAIPVLIVLLLFGGCMMTTNVSPGHVGIKVNKFGSSAGVSNQALGAGMYITGPGTYIVEYPVSTQTYAWTEKGEQNDTDESFQFQDKSGLGLSAGVSVSYHVDAQKAPILYQKYRMDGDAIVAGPLRNEIRNAIVIEASKMGVEDIYGPRKAELLNKALQDVKAFFSPVGLDVDQLYWASNIQLPEAVKKQITAKQENELAASAALAKVATAKADAESAVAAAEGRAKATSIEAQALRTNPEILQQKAIEKWDGHFPQYMGGGGALPFINLGK